MNGAYLERLTRSLGSHFAAEIGIALALMTAGGERMVRTEIVPQNVAAALLVGGAAAQAGDAAYADAAAFLILALNVLSII